MPCSFVYTVTDGDTLYSIAQNFNVSAETLLRLNPTLDPNNLMVGSEICLVSETGSDVICPYGSVAYNIAAGDTLFTIAQRFDTTVDALLLFNPTLNAGNLQVGQRICIMRPLMPLPACDTQNYYVIMRGDTLSAIAAVYGVSVADIIQLNPTLNPNRLKVGSVICIPTAPSLTEITVSVGARRLTVYRGGVPYREFIVSGGAEETPTPLGSFTVINKETDPGGPYGTRWLGLSKVGYGIHGTNDPQSIGLAVSNGCIRLYNEDMEILFNLTAVGTPVRILP